MLNETLDAINNIINILDSIINFILDILYIIGNILISIIEIPIMIVVALIYIIYAAFYYSTVIIGITIDILSAFINSFNVIFDRTLLFFNQLVSIFPPPIMFLLGIILLSIVILRIIKLLPTFD